MMKAGIAEVLFRPFHYRWRIDGQIAACLALVAWLFGGHLLDAQEMHQRRMETMPAKSKAHQRAGILALLAKWKGKPEHKSDF